MILLGNDKQSTRNKMYKAIKFLRIEILKRPKTLVLVLVAAKKTLFYHKKKEIWKCKSVKINALLLQEQELDHCKYKPKSSRLSGEIFTRIVTSIVRLSFGITLGLDQQIFDNIDSLPFITFFVLNYFTHQICITVIEARQLAGLNMDPVVCVQVFYNIFIIYFLWTQLSVSN